MLLKEIKSMISEIANIPTDEIEKDDSLESLGIDSLLTVELIMNLEKKYDIIFDASDINFQNFNSVKNIVSIVEKTKCGNL